MSNARQVWFGILAALISSAIILGSISLSLVESGSALALIATDTSTSSPSPTIPVETVPAGFPTFTPTSTHTPTATSTTPPPKNCPPPAGWGQIEYQMDETWESLAQKYGVTVEELLKSNCFDVNVLPIPGSVINVPLLPSPTATTMPTNTPTRLPTKTSIPCGPPPGWVRYTVRPGDNLYRLSQSLGVSIPQLQLANCLGSSITIRAGQSLFVPFLPVIPTNPPTWTSVPPTLPPPTSTPVPPTQPPPTTAPTQLPPTAAPTQPPPPTEAPTQPPPPTEVATQPPPPTEAPTQPPPPTEVPTQPPPPTEVQTLLPPPTRQPPSFTLAAPSPTPQSPSFQLATPAY